MNTDLHLRADEIPPSQRLKERGVEIAKAVMGRRNNQPIPLSQEESETLALALLQAVCPPGEVEGDSLVGTLPRSANERQVAGTHYGLDTFQHWDIVIKFGLDYFQGQITKYVMRWNKKNGVVDLEKAAHFLEKYLEEIKAGRIEDTAPKASQRKLYHDPT